MGDWIPTSGCGCTFCLNPEEYDEHGNSKYKKDEIMPNQRTMTKRYYVGSKSIASSDGSSPALKTLSEAIQDAKDMVGSSHTEILYVVEVVRIVRRVPRPDIIVEETR